MRKVLLTMVIALSLTTRMLGSNADTLMLRGQLSAWANYNITNNDGLFGGRYMPELSYDRNFRNSNRLYIETSANIFGNWPNSSATDEVIRPYRAWVRFSTPQFEVRAGLQKINFGSATILRPLMWFDQIDPNDPLQLTDGVWGLLSRYYFLNNTNFWLWGLYGNNEPKGWEQMGTLKKSPEFGGRLQIPIGLGEAAVTFHHRKVKSKSIFDEFMLLPDKFTENRLGLDAKIDWVVGFWIEGAWTNSRENIGLLTNQTLLNIGADYTFAIGNGLQVMCEHLIATMDFKPFEFKNRVDFSVASLSYPIGIFDTVGAMFYYSWDMKQVYSFVNWQRTYNKISLHLMAYWNPETFSLPQQNFQNNFFGGKGVQFMFVYNH